MTSYEKSTIAITDSRNLPWLPSDLGRCYGPLRGRQLIPSGPRRSSGAPWMMGASRCQGPLEDFWVVSANVELMLIVGFGWWFGIFPIPFSWHVKKNTRKNTWLACKKQTMTNHAMKHVWAGFKMVDFTAIVMLVIWGGKRTSRYMEKKGWNMHKTQVQVNVWVWWFQGVLLYEWIESVQMDDMEPTVSVWATWWTR